MQSEIEQFKVELKIAFKLTDLRILKYFFGLEFVQTSLQILLHQKKYACEVLRIVMQHLYQSW